MADDGGGRRRLLDRLASARARHHERHRPSGFGFALGDSIRYLDAAQWDAACAGQSLFLQRRYLQVLEDAGPDNLAPRYALIFRGREPVAAVVMQIVTISGTRFLKPDGGTPGGRLRRALTPAVRRVGEAVSERVLVCGNLLSWGFHAVGFAPGQAPAPIWPAVAEAIYRVRRAERLSGQANFALVKDLSAGELEGAAALRRFGYRPVESDPNMVLEIPATWRGYDDYLADLNAKYKNAARRIQKDLTQAGCAVRPVTLSPAFFPTLAAALGDDFRCVVVRREQEIVGFISMLRDGDTAVAYYIGFDRQAGVGNTVYLACCTRSSMRRFAWGAGGSPSGGRPWSPRRGWVPSRNGSGCGPRHRVPAMNVQACRFLPRRTSAVYHVRTCDAQRHRWSVWRFVCHFARLATSQPCEICGNLLGTGFATG